MADNVLPEAAWLADLFRCAGGLSVVMCVSFQICVVTRRLLTTTLMQQVFFLSVCDLLVHCWEMVVCKSFAHFDLFCLDYGGCDILFPLLRTFQIAEVLWTAQIAVGVALTVRQAEYCGRKCVQHLVWPVALVLSIPQWMAGAVAAFQPGPDAEGCQYEDSWKISPDQIFVLEVFLLLAVIIVAYVLSVWRIHQRSSAAAFSRYGGRALWCVMAFCICFLPWVICQDQASIHRSHLVQSSVAGQIMFLAYMCTGAANVIVYGCLHWDVACWKRRHRRTNSFGRPKIVHEARIVMFSSSAMMPNTDSSVSTALAAPEDDYGGDLLEERPLGSSSDPSGGSSSDLNRSRIQSHSVSCEPYTLS